jgi:hypothetical protein
MAIDLIKLAPNSFRTLFLRKEDRVILRTEAGRRIVIEKVIPGEWDAWRIYENERVINDNKRNILLIDRNYVSEVEKELQDKIR